MESHFLDRITKTVLPYFLCPLNTSVSWIASFKVKMDISCMSAPQTKAIFCPWMCLFRPKMYTCYVFVVLGMNYLNLSSNLNLFYPEHTLQNSNSLSVWSIHKCLPSFESLSVLWNWLVPTAGSWLSAVIDWLAKDFRSLAELHTCSLRQAVACLACSNATFLDILLWPSPFVLFPSRVQQNAAWLKISLTESSRVGVLSRRVGETKPWATTIPNDSMMHC